MTTRSTARHRKATRPLTPLSSVTPSTRRGLAVAASSGLALTMIASGANAASSTSVAESAGSLDASLGTIAADVRSAVATNEAITVTGAAMDVVTDTDIEVETAEEAAERIAAEEAEAAAAEAAAQAAREAEQAQTAASTQSGSVQTVSATASASGIAATAMQYVGSAYVWGASGPYAFDCSGLVSYVYAQHGISLPHSSGGIASSGGTVVSAASAQPGDVMWWPGHVAIYAGNGMMISAESESVGVQYMPVRSGATYYRF